MSIESGITLAQIIAAITARQPVLNQADLSAQDLQKTIVGIGSLEAATANQLSFLSNQAYASALATSQAGVILVAPEQAAAVPPGCVTLLVTSPYLAYACVSQRFEESPVLATNEKVIHPSAQVDPSAVLADGVRIGAFCVVGAGAHIGAGTQLQSHVHIGDDVRIGASCVMYPHVYIGYNCVIGNRVRIHPNATIGAEGFGFAPMPDTAAQGWERIVQLGRVVIGDGVRIGSNTCVDRGAIHDTVIHDHVIIDNLVQVGHNSIIGAGTAIAGTAGLAGSSILGKRCMIGGAAGVSGHLEISDDVILTGMTMATKSIKEPGVYSSGLTAMPSKKWRQVMVKLRSFAEEES